MISDFFQHMYLVTMIASLHSAAWAFAARRHGASCCSSTVAQLLTGPAAPLHGTSHRRQTSSICGEACQLRGGEVSSLTRQCWLSRPDEHAAREKETFTCMLRHP
ncbi:hypothetical protein FB567DRAFT_39212 [Paraphoma chrysanthemicola]|uniref:Secreted protein n=1 Tax=Paraphoma chrysanthemicola TaxID=798071 RepID=A0A8K0RLW7_9PLEO|nr:hypothetical protein FB567DRAFT_39212 [Paraphoma chrysanthemicola]